MCYDHISCLTSSPHTGCLVEVLNTFWTLFREQDLRVWSTNRERWHQSHFKSSLKFKQSVMIFGESCHLLVWVHFVLSSRKSDQQDLAPAHTTKRSNTWFKDCGITLLDETANRYDLKSILTIVSKKDERQLTQQHRGAQGCYEINLGFIYTSTERQADHLNALLYWSCN